MRQAASRPLRRTLGPAHLNSSNAFLEPSVNLVVNTLTFVAVAVSESKNQGLHALSGQSVLRRPARGRRSVTRTPSARTCRLVRPSATGLFLLPQALQARLAGKAGQTGSIPMQQVSTVRHACPWLPSQSRARLLAMRSISLAARPPRPNPSVKGTSCGRPQAAPYLER